MHPKTRIAVLIAALMFGAQAGVAAIEESTSLELAEAADQPTEVAPAESTAAPEVIASAEPAAPPDTAQRPAAAPPATATVRNWYDRIVIALSSGTPPPVFPEGSNGDADTWLMPIQIAYFERLEQQRLARLQPQGEAQPAAAEVHAQAGNADLQAAHDAAASAIR
jgi:hypothetical protein